MGEMWPEKAKWSWKGAGLAACLSWREDVMRPGALSRLSMCFLGLLLEPQKPPMRAPLHVVTTSLLFYRKGSSSFGTWVNCGVCTFTLMVSFSGTLSLSWPLSFPCQQQTNTNFWCIFGSLILVDAQEAWQKVHSGIYLNFHPLKVFSLLYLLC